MIKKFVFYIFIAVLIILSGSFSIISNNFCAQETAGLIYSSINVNGDTRNFYIYTPLKYRQDLKFEKYPLVMILHGAAADGVKIMNGTKFNETADKSNFIAVYPEKMNILDWDLKQAEKSKDVTFIKKLLGYLETNYRVNKSRIYIAGYSSGGDFSLLLACSMPDKIAGFVSVCGNMKKSFIVGCQTHVPVPVFMINGVEDPYDKWNGNGNDMLSVKDSLNFWEKHNKCGENEKQTIFPHKNPNNTATTAKLFTRSNCLNKSEVSLLEIDGGGHTWPGASTSIRIETFLGKTNTDVSANDLLIDFFNRHELPKKF